ncbi:hypothetical protein [Desulfocucumis palustris]|uniref:hypothetical protein n=1 Tax=Desulfocucumis palustris TaxID=1898651 RepID=UPI000CE9B686|nr:hypothetical protein [Desulfocucumis palustris]
MLDSGKGIDTSQMTLDELDSMYGSMHGLNDSLNQHTTMFLGVVGGMRVGAGEGVGKAEKLYHYTSASPESILKNGLHPGASGKVFTTPAGNLSPMQAQIDEALNVLME